MTDARVTVVIPCFNEQEPLLEAIDSIREREPVDVIVVDDCSTEPMTHDLLHRIEGDGVRVLRHEHNSGPAGARMTALAAVQTPYVFTLDSDDVVEPGVLGRMADVLDADPAAAVCYGDHVEFAPEGDDVLRRSPDWIDAFRLTYVDDYPPAAMFRRSALEEIGGWQPPGHTLFAYEDWHVWMSLAERGLRGVHIGRDVVTYRRRLHGERLLQRSRRRHGELYRTLRSVHPDLFAARRRNRRASNLPRWRRLLYPIVYGGRRKFRFEHRLRLWLERRGIRISGG